MGNQVTTLGQIYPLEYYLADYCNEFTLEASLGSTRFMKVARVNHKEAGYCVAKIYAINDSMIPVQKHKLKLEAIRDSIRQSKELNCLPFSLCLVNEKCIILLRQYIKYNLYDRLSTRPFLTPIEKLWIAYQLLRCVQSLHRQSICHGDIKSENVLVTSFLWITLADFASYKPVTLPENNPSDFSYFFDTSRRHCCNMAPERFVEQASFGTESDTYENKSTHHMGDNEVQLLPQMDLFSLGCVLAELFHEDTPNSSIFDLGQILMFKKNKHDPTKFIEDGISDTRVRDLILNLTDLDPNKRNSASYHLDQLVPSLFPAYFQNLYDYFAKLIPLSPDSKILTMEKDLNKILEEIITEDEHGLVLPLILVTSILRALKTTEVRLAALRLCVKMVESSPATMSDFIIDRLLPYIMHLLTHPEPRVRATSIESLDSVLRHTEKLQSGDANIFIDYILPSLLPLAYDPSTLVRISLALNISSLAETSKRFSDPTEKGHETRLNLFQEAFGAIIRQLLVDPNNSVRRAILNENVTKLCNFFGKEKTDEFILSHIITFLNDKTDFHLRAAFFDSISQISSSLGPYYAPVIKPLMQKGLADSEEIVIYKCLKALESMTSKGLMPKDVVCELFQEAVPLLSFPNKWIRNAVINFVLVLSKADESVDFNRRILPSIKLHLTHDINGLRDEAVLLDSLQNPLPRLVIDSILNGDGDIDEIFHTVTKRKMSRDKKRYRTVSETDTQDFDALTDGIITNRSESDLLSTIDQFNEDKLIDSELILRKISKNKRVTDSKYIESHINVRRQDAVVQNNYNNIDPRLMMSSTSSLSKTTRPRGILLAHLHEHKKAVNKVVVIPGTTSFISCSNDATIKFWDCAGVSTKPHVLFRSKQTFISPDAGAVTTISTCASADVLLALTDSNNLHLIQLNSPARFVKSVNFSSDFTNPELVTDLVSLSPFTYATCSTSSNLRGYDLRLPTTTDVWNLRMDGNDGLITCLDGNEYCIACGTSSSVIAMFDLRFYIRATTMSYPKYQDKRKRIRRLVLCNDEIYCSVDGNNEVITWNCESASRSKTLWASSAPCLSSTHSSHYSVLSMIVDTNKDTASVVTAGDDMKIRFWDMNNPHRSYVVSRPPVNVYHKLTDKKLLQQGKPAESDSQVNNVYYQTKLVDGIQVIQETDKSTPMENSSSRTPQSPSAANVAPQNTFDTSSSSSSNAPARNSNLTNPFEHSSLSASHHDSISCLASVSQNSLLLSASRDGVIKIWR